MQLGKYKTLFVASASSLLFSCGQGPIVDVCISYPTHNGFVCVNKYQKTYFLPFKDSSKYIAFSPSDAQILINACGIKGKAKDQVVEYYTAKIEEAAE